MAVALDTVDEFAQWTTATPVTKTFTPVGTPRGIFVGIAQVAAVTDDIVSVTYGGVALTRIASAQITAAGRAYMYFLGASIPTGAQTVSIGTTGGGATRWAGIASVTAAADTQILVSGIIQTGTANPQIAVNSGTASALRMCIMYVTSGLLPSNYVEVSGMAAPVAAAEHPFGGVLTKLGRQASPSSGSFTIGYTQAQSDNVMMAAGAIEEILPAVTGTAAGVQAPQVFAATGTSTAPVPPTPAAGNRMGGTGAVRKPPR